MSFKDTGMDMQLDVFFCLTVCATFWQVHMQDFLRNFRKIVLVRENSKSSGPVYFKQQLSLSFQPSRQQYGQNSIL